MEFLILSNWCGFEKPNHYYFVLKDDPLTVFRRQNHVSFIFIKTMSHDLLVHVAYSLAASPVFMSSQVLPTPSGINWIGL